MELQKIIRQNEEKRLHDQVTIAKEEMTMNRKLVVSLLINEVESSLSYNMISR